MHYLYKIKNIDKNKGDKKCQDIENHGQTHY